MKYRILCNEGNTKNNQWVWPEIAKSDLNAVNCESLIDKRFETDDINLAYRYMYLLLNSRLSILYNWKMEVKEYK